MPEKEIASFSVRRVEVLGPDGNADPSLDPNLPEEVLQDLYRNMLLARSFDRRAVKLQRQGRMGTYAPYEGHEAIQMASVLALDTSDPIFPSYRDSAAMIQRGVPMDRMLLYWMGREEGNRHPDERIFPINIGVGTQMLHAVGAAYAGRMLGNDVVSLSFFGDGASSQGDFYEALNFGGAWRIPAVFLCQNNGWAISVPLSKQTAAGTLAQKAIAAGIEGVQVDGNDVLAVYRVVKEAVDKARAGDGPTMIEAMTYRIAIHTTSDDPKRYQPEDERAKWEELEPLRRFRLYLEAKGLWSEEEEQAAQTEIDEKIKAAVKVAEEEAPKAELRDMFESTFAEMTPILQRQMEQLAADEQEVSQ